jgi:hypothetical protein
VASSTSLISITFPGTQKGLQWPSANYSIAGMMRDSSARLSCIAATLGQTHCQECRRQGSYHTAEEVISVASGSSTKGQLQLQDRAMVQRWPKRYSFATPRR